MARRTRRFWSEDEKRRMVAQTYVPGVSVSQVGRRYDINANLIFKWRRDPRYRPPAGPRTRMPRSIRSRMSRLAVSWEHRFIRPHLDDVTFPSKTSSSRFKILTWRSLNTSEA